MEIPKNTLTTAIIAISVVLAAYFLGTAFKNRNQNNAISVTGLGTKDFVSDLIVWNGTFSKNNLELKTAYAELEQDRQKIKNYLISKGFAEKDIVFSAVDINKQYEYRNYTGYVGDSSQKIFTGYQLNQTVTIESKDVQKVENLSRQITELINNGVELYSPTPAYYYTKLSDLKIQMIAEATKDAKKRAEEIAKNAGGKLGQLKKANLGVFQITAQNSSDEDYSWGGTFNISSKNKTANVTIRLDYEAK
ncbi:MAG: SIMPL domain-containing protein [Flavobacteriaceae bacterium]|jgi:hypothetical protein|nr:SIMPL domain-containing protein [Flavobacteriaceae bacterium]